MTTMLRKMSYLGEGLNSLLVIIIIIIIIIIIPSVSIPEGGFKN